MADRDRLSRALSEAVSRAVSDALDSALPQTCNRVSHSVAQPRSQGLSSQWRQRRETLGTRLSVAIAF